MVGRGALREYLRGALWVLPTLSVLAALAAGAVLSFFGFIHGEKIGLAQTPAVSVSYLAVAAVLVYCAKFALVAPKAAEIEHPGGLGHEHPGGLGQVAE